MRCLAAFVASALGGATWVSAFAPSLGVRPHSRSLGSNSRLYDGGDGNPPPFSDWGQPQAPAPEAPVAPAPADYSSWGQPQAAAPAPAAPADYSSWGQPQQAAAPAPAPAPADFSAWGQPQAAAATATTPPAPAPAAPAPAVDYSTWGQPAAAAAAPAPADYSSWGQPAAAVAAPQPQEQPPSLAPPPPAAAAPAAGAGSAAATGVVAGDPISVLHASQTASVQQIAAAIGPDLAVKPDLSWSRESVGGSSAATLDARDAPGPANVAWLASVHIPNQLSSLTIFNGPLTDVPHLLSRACLINNGQDVQLRLDFRPRAYGAYELQDSVTGQYPGPEELGRKAFEYSGARNDYDGRFGTPDVVALLEQAVASLEGAVTTDTPTELERLTGGPLAIAVTLPATDANIAAVAALREQAAATWLRWAATEGADQHGHRPGAPINSQYVYDAKFRQNAYSALLEYYSGVFGPQDGAKLAAAESGPLDEAYVGGAS